MKKLSKTEVKIAILCKNRCFMSISGLCDLDHKQVIFKFIVIVLKQRTDLQLSFKVMNKYVLT